jgi:hypothetical protein
MLRRRTVLAIAKLATACFEYNTFSGSRGIPTPHVRTDWFADLLFEKDHDEVLVTTARSLDTESGTIKSFILNLYSGVTLELLVVSKQQSAVDLSLIDRSELAQETLQKLAADLLEYAHRPREKILIHIDRMFIEELLASLELDGFQWKDDRLLRIEENTFDVEQEGILEELYRSVGLGNLPQIRHELKLTDEHYVAGRWGDCIKHARDLAECVLLEVVKARAALGVGTVPVRAREAAVTVRTELHSSGFLDDREVGFMNALWKLLSEQGGHMNMSAQENARICRQYALTAAHFVLLRFQALHPTVVPTNPGPSHCSTAPACTTERRCWRCGKGSSVRRPERLTMVHPDRIRSLPLDEFREKLLSCHECFGPAGRCAHHEDVVGGYKSGRIGVFAGSYRDRRI